MKPRVGVLIEEPLAVVFGREALGEPLGQAAGLPIVKMKDGAL
jgi:hypothetical protein